MNRFFFLFVSNVFLICNALNLEYLDPKKLQTKTSPEIQQRAASEIIEKYSKNVIVKVDPKMFHENKDAFLLRANQGVLHITASSGVAAVWGFHYYLKKYCKSHVSWQSNRIEIPDPLPSVKERVVANDRFRYYQNVCTYSYSFVWWNIKDWKKHIEWMALNGINLALSPIDQEAAWATVFNKIGMTDKEINTHFTGPAFLSWLRMGNIHGWGGPLVKSWHEHQSGIQSFVLKLMFDLGMIPVIPSFNGHVPRAFARIYPDVKFHKVNRWNRFPDDYCCGLFVNPAEPLFKSIGGMFLTEVTKGVTLSHIYSADVFNEVILDNMADETITEIAEAVFSIINEFDDKGVWLTQNWMFINMPLMWSKDSAKALLTAVPNGRMLILDVAAENFPKFNEFDMYFGQPFVWCMLHNFGGTLGMVGKIPTVNEEVYKARSKVNSTMIGIGLTPEGINQNYVVYDFMLETSWRKNAVENLTEWVSDYAERRYGCKTMDIAWNNLLQSVYSYNKTYNYEINDYVMTSLPSFEHNVTAWYNSQYLFEAFSHFAFAGNQCDSDGFRHDLVDVTRQALQYRAEQIYLHHIRDAVNDSTVREFIVHVTKFLDILNDMELILASNEDFTAIKWFKGARDMATNDEERLFYTMNARTLITIWGPRGEIMDYGAKQWAEMFHYYYIPKWNIFLNKAIEAKVTKKEFDQAYAQYLVMVTVETKFNLMVIDRLPSLNSMKLAKLLYTKWGNNLYLPDLPSV